MTRSQLSRATIALLALLALVLMAVAGPVTGLGLTGYSSAVYSSSSTSTGSVTAAADWTPPTVSLRSPGSSVSGTVTLTADAFDAVSGVDRVVLQHRTPGGAWATLCTVPSGSGSAFACTWDTTTVADGSRELRAVATDRAGYSSSSAVTSTAVSNATDVELASPGTSVRGTVLLTATVRPGAILYPTVIIQYRISGSSSWAFLCVKPFQPYSCAWDTTTLTDGTYDLRALATSWTTTATSPIVRAVRVDNTAPTVALADPGTPLRQSANLAATAADSGSGVATVRIQTAANGSSTWTDICTLTTTPFACRYDTTQIADGTWSFRAQATDAAGNTATSATVRGRVIDNGPQLSGVDVQAKHGGRLPGTLDTGDTLSLTYSREVALGSITPSWDGSPLPVTLRLRDGKLVNKTTVDDTIDVLRSGSVVGLGTVNLGRNQVNVSKTLVFAATMRAQTVVVDGTQATRLTITLTDNGTGDGKQSDTRSDTSALAWAPSVTALDLLGRPALTDVVTRTVTTDRYF